MFLRYRINCRGAMCSIKQPAAAAFFDRVCYIYKSTTFNNHVPAPLNLRNMKLWTERNAEIDTGARNITFTDLYLPLLTYTHLPIHHHFPMQICTVPYFLFNIPQLSIGISMDFGKHSAEFQLFASWRNRAHVHGFIMSFMSQSIDLQLIGSACFGVSDMCCFA